MTSVVAWLADEPGRDALGPTPLGVTLVDEPTPEVEFVVPAWASIPDLTGLPALKVVQVRSAGVDWIVGAVPPGVTLCSARGTRDRAMAEWIVTALLADAKQVRPFAEGQAAARWQPHDVRDLLGTRVLILGHGSIGRETERLLAPFGCAVTGVARRARDGVHGLDELPVLARATDVLVNLLPLTAATRGLVGAGLLARLPDGALYVNAGRGATTDTGALLAELRSGRLRAVLDVVDPEPLPAEHALWHAPGVLISPHIAGDSPEGERAAWRLVAEQLRRHVAGEPLRNVVRDGY